MELFLKVLRWCPSSFRGLSKLVSDFVDKVASVIEYLYPDFEGKSSSE